MILTALAAAALNDIYAKRDLPAAVKAYRQCVREKSAAFEQAGESVEYTVKASFETCGSERATIILIVDELADQQGLSFERKRIRREGALDLVETPLRSEITEELMLLRSAKSKSRRQ